MIYSLVLFFMLFAEAQVDKNIVFVVNRENPTNELTLEQIRNYYYKISRRWPNGEEVRFIDRSSPQLREVFLKKILRKTNSEVELFWIGQKLYTGNNAPLREASDRITIEFVSSFKGAIGYISLEAAHKAKNVKIINQFSNEDQD